MNAILTQPTHPTTPPTAETVTLMCLHCGLNEQVPPDELVTRIAAHTHGENLEEGDERETAETPELTIAELVRTPARFRSWLERMRAGFGPDFFVGEACASFACPLNQFISDETGRDPLSVEVEISPAVVQVYRIDDGEATVEREGGEVRLPAWAAAFARQVDLYPSGRKVRADEALFLLDYIEQRVADANGVRP